MTPSTMSALLMMKPYPGVDQQCAGGGAGFRRGPAGHRGICRDGEIACAVGLHCGIAQVGVLVNRVGHQQHVAGNLVARTAELRRLPVPGQNQSVAAGFVRLVLGQLQDLGIAAFGRHAVVANLDTPQHLGPVGQGVGDVVDQYGGAFGTRRTAFLDAGVDFGRTADALQQQNGGEEAQQGVEDAVGIHRGWD